MILFFSFFFDQKLSSKKLHIFIFIWKEYSFLIKKRYKKINEIKQIIDS
jgi:hypothetical protein